jgi:histone H3/H4
VPQTAEVDILCQYAVVNKENFKPAWSMKAFVALVRELEHHHVVNGPPEIADDFISKKSRRWTPDAIQILAQAADSYIVEVLNSGWQLSEWGSRMTLMGQDVVVAAARQQGPIARLAPETIEKVASLTPIPDSRRKKERLAIRAGEQPGIDFIKHPGPTRKQVQRRLRRPVAALRHRNQPDGCMECQDDVKFGPGTTRPRRST